MESQQGRIEAERVSHIVCVKCEKVLDVGHLPSFSEITCPECGTKQVVPAQFGAFILLGRLGFGGMGVIYRAEDRELGRHVALKVMKKSLGENAEFVKAFKDEARAAAALNHQNVVQIYSFGQHEGQPYIVMELVGGGRLDEIIADGGQIDEVRALEIHLEVGEGLRAASDVGLVHGDVKPANILFGKNGEAKVVDFGLASYIGQQQEGGQVWGTPYYIAPEKARRKKVDFRSDIYSLGGTMFHALAGEPPFDGPTPLEVVLARLNHPAPDLTDFREDIHPQTAAMVARMLEMTPTMRYPSYPALLYDMHEALNAARGSVNVPSSKTVTPGTVIPVEPSGRRLALRIAGIVLGTLLLCGGAVAGWMLYEKHQARVAAEAAEKKSYSEARDRGMSTFPRFSEARAEISEAGDAVKAAAEKISAISKSVQEAESVAAGISNHVEKVQQAASNAVEILAKASDARQALETAADSKAAADTADALESLAGSMDAVVQTARESFAAVELALENASAIQAKALESADQTREKAKKERELARQAAARKKADEEAKKRELQERQEAERIRQETIQRELDLVDEARAANVPLIAQRKFNEAVEAFASLLPQLSMQETQADYKNVLDGYKAIVKLKQFLIRSIQSSPCRGGWVLGNKKRDIVQADPDEGLKIALGDVGTTFIPWEQVTVPQLLRIAKYYVENMLVQESERADVLLSMALFCYESGDFKRAETCAALAYRLNQSLRPDIDRMMPDLLAEESEETEGNE